MKLINKIYGNLYEGTPEAVQENKKMERDINNLLKEPDYKNMDSEKCWNLVVDSNCIGHAQGFECGFRFAVNLLLDAITG